MRAESNIRPERFELEVMSDKRCDLIFYDNITEVETETDQGVVTKYTFDMYRIESVPRPTLERDVEANYESWLEYAKKEEYNSLAEKMRQHRDKLLAQSDKYLLEDYPLTDMQRQKVMDYRQELRDLTIQEYFPYQLKWPMLG